jgi:hypothetical protein
MAAVSFYSAQEQYTKAEARRRQYAAEGIGALEHYSLCYWRFGKFLEERGES